MEGFVALEDRVQRERRDSASAACAAGGACSKVEGLRICASLVEGAPKYKKKLADNAKLRCFGKAHCQCEEK